MMIAKQDTAQETAARDARALIEGLELPYLIAMRGELDRHIEKRQVEAIQQARVEVQRIAMSVGLPLETLMAGVSDKPPRKRSGKLYRNADGQEWTGHGRKPKWVHDALASGQTLESLLVSE